MDIYCVITVDFYKTYQPVFCFSGAAFAFLNDGPSQLSNKKSSEKFSFRVGGRKGPVILSGMFSV